MRPVTLVKKLGRRPNFISISLKNKLTLVLTLRQDDAGESTHFSLHFLGIFLHR